MHVGTVTLSATQDGEYRYTDENRGKNGTGGHVVR